MADQYSTIQQHQPLRTPASWDKQGKAFVVQLEEVLDDIYRRFGRLRMQDLSKTFQKQIMDDEGNIAELILDVSQITIDVGNKYDKVSGIAIEANGITISGSKYIDIASGCTLDIESGGKINVKSGGELDVKSGSNMNVESGGHMNIQSGGNLEVKSGGSFNLKTGGAFTIDSGNFAIDQYGNVTFNGGGTFSGALSAATGTFAGTMSAACITSGTMSANRISGGTIDATNVSITNLSASNIVSGTMSANRISGGSIDASNVTINNLDAGKITTGTMSANKISGGSIDASNVTITNLNASNITSGTMSASKISGGSIDASNVTITNLNASNITSGTMSASKISGGTLVVGGSNNTNGQIQIKNASGTTIGTINKDGFDFSGSLSINSGGSLDVNATNFKISSANKRLQSGNWIIDDNGLYYNNSSESLNFYITKWDVNAGISESGIYHRYGSDSSNVYADIVVAPVLKVSNNIKAYPFVFHVQQGVGPGGADVCSMEPMFSQATSGMKISIGGSTQPFDYGYFDHIYGEWEYASLGGGTSWNMNNWRSVKGRSFVDLDYMTNYPSDVPNCYGNYKGPAVVDVETQGTSGDTLQRLWIWNGDLYTRRYNYNRSYGEVGWTPWARFLTTNRAPTYGELSGRG